MANRRGLYEILVSEELAPGLLELGDALRARTDELRPADAANRIALHLARVLERSLDDLSDQERVRVGIGLARQLIQDIARMTGAGADTAPVEAATVLRAILSRQPDGTDEMIEQPLIPLLDTALLTNAPGEPVVGRQAARPDCDARAQRRPAAARLVR